MEQATSSILLVGKPGHMRDALASLLGALPAVGPVHCADSGLLALKLVRESHPSAVIVTAALPETEAPELVSQIKQHWPKTACLVMAEKSEHQRQAFIAGADCVLTGGIGSEQLLYAVEKLFEK